MATGGAEEKRVCLKKLKCHGDITERKLKVKMEGEKSEEERSVTLFQLSGWSQGELTKLPSFSCSYSSRQDQYYPFVATLTGTTYVLYGRFSACGRFHPRAIKFSLPGI